MKWKKKSGVAHIPGTCCALIDHSITLSIPSSCCLPAASRLLSGFHLNWMKGFSWGSAAGVPCPQPASRAVWAWVTQSSQHRGCIAWTAPAPAPGWSLESVLMVRTQTPPLDFLMMHSSREETPYWKRHQPGVG